LFLAKSIIVIDLICRNRGFIPYQTGAGEPPKIASQMPYVAVSEVAALIPPPAQRPPQNGSIGLSLA